MSLETDAGKMLERMKLAPPREPGEELRPADIALILELHDGEKTQAEIASIVGCSQSTVSRTVSEWTGTCGIARKYAEAQAFKMMERFIKEAGPKELLHMMVKLEILPEDRASAGGNRVVVFVGTPEAPLRIPGIRAGASVVAVDAIAETR